ncbi:GNAT family N-acetyltransferase [Robertmurraya andreesenii]|uniref:Ribosomal-protein-alanine N-acetyltransferase n=1 Tax=Anoxybacillus andreesenii TaxID=1325932 RepID=A0ABT9VAK7_9BACL|nr:GNAT family N-acetyltransferase [Robertmurraya andreesenii]MDQ0157988.1 ribosomal-protein-alanine N-acetyltransferase [Robertmurraya andreesenii]
MTWNEAFETFPVLETARLRLRNLEVTDAPSIFRYFSMDKVMEYYDLETFTSQQQAIDLIEGLLFRYETGRQIRWGITLKDDNVIIGSCGFHALEEQHLKVEIGYDLHPDYWSKGIMTEVIQKVVDFGFRVMELNRIEAFYDPMNIASRKVLEKNGFQYEGTLRKRFLNKGKFVDAVLSSLLREEYLE